MDTTIIERVVREMENMPRDQQYRVLEFARTLTPMPRGVPGRDLLKFAGTISAEDLRLMSEAIEEDCERIDPAES